jgi:hypothetical protein
MADLLSEEDNKAFWDGYLSDDMPKMLQVAENALSRIGRISDPRMKEVMTDGLTYAISHPDEFTLICTNGKALTKARPLIWLLFLALWPQHILSVKNILPQSRN